MLLGMAMSRIKLRSQELADRRQARVQMMSAAGDADDAGDAGATETLKWNAIGASKPD